MSASTDTSTIQPFTFDFPDAELDDLRARIAATRWSEPETVRDQSQGTPQKTLKELARYWAEEYDWRKVEAKLKALPHFTTEIDGLDIHFIHLRSKHEDALPLLVTHGWPGSVIEQLKIIEPLADPTVHGGTAADAFHLVVPSMPGYGFSGKPTESGWNPQRMAKAWGELMNRLGYTRYVASGGDWGAIVTEQMGLQEPEGLIGFHTNMANAVPPDIDDRHRGEALRCPPTSPSPRKRPKPSSNSDPPTRTCPTRTRWVPPPRRWPLWWTRLSVSRRSCSTTTGRAWR